MNAVGVDVGGTKIAAGVVSAEGALLAETRHPTPPEPEKLFDPEVAAAGGYVLCY